LPGAVISVPAPVREALYTRLGGAEMLPDALHSARELAASIPH